ncbi:DUF5828 family protein [Candidatus Nanosalina sp. VS9-1]|uniref:DUF5828 family protein n=1 Tax=Candidatus Nanosalina sp. VS9-1 TaxID=3388566 RepID=UPI0039E06FC0
MPDKTEQDKEVEQTNSGVKKEGNWKEIAEFGEQVEEALEDTAEDSIEKFGDWRPKLEESESDVKRKTVDEAVSHEKKLEEKTNGVKEDLKQASDKMAEAGKKATMKELPDKEIIEPSEEAARPFYSRVVGLIRRIEQAIYSWVTLRFNPYYLDTEDFSVDIRDRKGGKFEMDVSVLEEEKREQLQDNFREDN